MERYRWPASPRDMILALAPLVVFTRSSLGHPPGTVSDQGPATQWHPSARRSPPEPTRRLAPPSAALAYSVALSIAVLGACGFFAQQREVNYDVCDGLCPDVGGDGVWAEAG